MRVPHALDYNTQAQSTQHTPRIAALDLNNDTGGSELEQHEFSVPHYHALVVEEPHQPEGAGTPLDRGL